MLIGKRWPGRRKAAAAVVLGLLMAGAVDTPAHAEGMRAQQWFLDAMKAEQMWRTSTGKGVTVAVIDTGVDADVPDLRGQVLRGRDYAEEQPGDEHTDYRGHGTGMAALIAGTGAANGGNGAFGLAPGTRILPVRVPNVEEDAANEAEAIKVFNQVVPEAIRYSVDAGAKVVNISLAQEEGSPELTAAVKYALDRGALIFAGVGNKAEEGNPLEYPASTPGVVGVAAVGKNLSRTSFSQFGPNIDVAAPGEDMVAACTGKTGFCESRGTSEATAIASASAALIWAAHPEWTNNQVLRVMLNTIGGPTNGAKRNDSIGYGIVRPRIALQDPGDPGPADVYPLPDLAAAASSSPSESAPVAHGAGGAAKGGEAAAAGTSSEGDGNGMLWIGLGAAAVLALGGGGAAYAVSRRRRSLV